MDGLTGRRELTMVAPRNPREKRVVMGTVKLGRDELNTNSTLSLALPRQAILGPKLAPGFTLDMHKVCSDNAGWECPR